MTKQKTTSIKTSFLQKLFIFRNSDVVKAPRNSNYVLLVAIVSVLNIIGAVMVLSASSVSAIGNYGTPWFFFQRQLIWLTLGAAAFIVMSRIPYSFWQKYTLHIVVITAILLVVVLIPSIGIEVYGARRWLGAGSWRFQPSELAKFALIIFCADILTRRENKIDSFHDVLKPILFTSAAICGLVVIEPDFDTTMILVLIVTSMVIMAGVPFKFLGKIGMVVVPLGLLVMLIEPYRRERLLSFRDPFADAQNSGYQLIQSLIAFGSGGPTGVGLGEGKAKYNYLPNAHTDFIFSIIGEELGFIGTMMVIGLFVAFILLGIKIALSSTDRFAALMATGIVTWIGAQATINLLAAVGVLPVAGITLPFVSFGGSSLLISMAATGILANIARYSRA